MDNAKLQGDEYDAKPVHKRHRVTETINVIIYMLAGGGAIYAACTYGLPILHMAPLDAMLSTAIGALLGLWCGIARVAARRRDYKTYGTYQE